MTLLIGFLTFILVMNCLFLMLLVLIQLPKKEAGAGIAFGGAATDALFGAGSGNALTKLTKYSATLFVGLSIGLSVLNMHAAKQGSMRLEQELNKQISLPTRPAPSAPNANALTPAAPPVTTAPAAGNLLTPTLTNQAQPRTTATPQAEAPAPAAPAKTPPAAPAQAPK